MAAGEVRATRQRASWWAHQDWLLAVALAFFVGLCVWFARAIADFISPSTGTFAAPSLVGETLGDALTTAQHAKLHAVVVSHQPSDRYPRDLVMQQDPADGTMVRAGRQLSLVISSGVQIFSMPDLRYESMREVGLALARFKLVLGKTRYVESEDAEPNHVAAQYPPPLSSVRVGTVVNFDLSKGGHARMKTPSFTGLSVEEARDIAAQQHVRLGQIVWTPFGTWGPPRGYIVRQSPDAGTQIDPSFDQVSLQVSAGPGQAGYLVRQVHATAIVPDEPDRGGKSLNVRVQVRDETGEWNVFNGFAEPRQKLDFNLTVVGTSELELYVDNELLSSRRIGNEPVQAQKKPGQTPAGGGVEGPRAPIP